MVNSKYLLVFLLGFLFCGFTKGEILEENLGTVEDDLGVSREALRTDEDVIAREEEAIKIDGLNVAQMKQIREQGEKHAFQAEVNRLMKLIINSLYKNKEIFLRELISNASDALDKIRFLSLTNTNALDSNPDMNIKVKADKDNNVLHIIDTGIGMTKQDLLDNLGTIAKSGTSDFLAKFQDSKSSNEASDLIGQFGVGFYSAFLVADRVVVTTKNNDDKQYIWQSDASQFSIAEDPRGDTLGRGTIISLHLKEEAIDFLEVDTLEALIRKYSQFINFPIYLWKSKTEEVEEPIEEEEAEEEKTEEEADKTEDEEGKVEEEKEEEKPKTKKVTKTSWDYELINEAKPIWVRKIDDITEDEYTEFYKALAKDSKKPLAKIHFIAEGEVTFKSLLYVPSEQPSEMLNRYGSKNDNIKLYVRRVFITDDFQDMMPNYLSFIRGIVDSDDFPLNVSRENLQQHKLLKVIKKKLVRKVLDMLKKLDPEIYEKFWGEYSTNIKLGLMEDASNKNRLAKLLRFHSSNSEKMTSLAEYAERMKEKQTHIFYMAGGSLKEVKTSPFVERLLNKGYEVLYLVEAVDEYAINAIPEFEGKKFQNVAKEGLELDDGAAAKELRKKLNERFEPLNKWFSETVLKDHISRSIVSERLTESPCALVSSRFGWTANMQRIVTSQAHSKSKESQRDYQMDQKKMLEINPRHPLIKELLKRVESDAEDSTAKSMALMMFHTATLRSGYPVSDTADFAKSIEEMMRQNLGVPLDEAIEEEPELVEEEEEVEEQKAETEEDEEQKDAGGAEEEMKDEL